MKTFKAQAARDALAAGLGIEYAEYLEKSAHEHYEYFMRKGDPAQAQEMLTRNLGEALKGNNGI